MSCGTRIIKLTGSGGGGPYTVVDNPDGTSTVTDTGSGNSFIVNNGGGPYVVVDNPDGTTTVTDTTSTHSFTLTTPIVFGSSFSSYTDSPVTINSTDTFVSKLNDVTESLPIGEYLLTVNYGWNHNATTSDFESRLLSLTLSPILVSILVSSSAISFLTPSVTKSSSEMELTYLLARG